MAAAVMNCLRTALLGALVVQLYATQIGHRKFEYKYSFKGPYLAQKDGSVPFWEYGGSEWFWQRSSSSTRGSSLAARPIWAKDRRPFSAHRSLLVG